MTLFGKEGENSLPSHVDYRLALSTSNVGCHHTLDAVTQGGGLPECLLFLAGADAGGLHGGLEGLYGSVEVGISLLIGIFFEHMVEQTHTQHQLLRVLLAHCLALGDSLGHLAEVVVGVEVKLKCRSGVAHYHFVDCDIVCTAVFVVMMMFTFHECMF